MQILQWEASKAWSWLLKQLQVKVKEDKPPSVFEKNLRISFEQHVTHHYS